MTFLSHRLVLRYNNNEVRLKTKTNLRITGWRENPFDKPDNFQLSLIEGNRMSRPFYFILGWISLLLALIGVPLPLLPTTPFVLLAAFCFSRSSTRFHQWLINNRLFGPIIIEWETYGVIPLKVKFLATFMMLTMVSYPLLFKDLPIWAIVSVITVIIIALSYIWSRPSYPKPTTIVAEPLDDS